MRPNDLESGFLSAPTRCLPLRSQSGYRREDRKNKEPASESTRLRLSALIGWGQSLRATIHPVLVLLLLSGALGWTSEALATATVNKQFTPATVDPGDISRFRITVGNSSLVPLTAAAVTDNLPANIKIANPINAANTCGFTGVTAIPGTSQIVLTGGTVPAASGTDGLCYFELDVVSTAVGNWINTIPKDGPSNGFTPGGSVSGFQALEGGVTIANTTNAVATLSVRGLSPPTGVKTYTPTAGLVGQPFTINIVLTNPNPNSTLPLTSFTDNLPAGMVVATTPDATVNCTGTGAANGTFAPAAGASAMTLTGGRIGAGGTCTLTAKAVVSMIAGLSQSFNNQIPANAIGNTRGLTSAAFSRSIAVSSPVTVTKSFSPTTLRAGQTGSLSIVINNSASATVGLLINKFTDNLPAGLLVAAAGTKTVTCTTGTAGTLTAVAGSSTVTLVGAATGASSTTAANRRCTIVVPVTAVAAGSYPNSTANTGPDTVITNSLVSPSPLPVPVASATLKVNSQLTVDKIVSDNTVAPGETTIFTVTLRNWSAGVLGGVAFTDNLPLVAGNQMRVTAPGATLGVGCSGGTFSGAAGVAAVTWTGGTVAGGSGGNAGTCTISIPVTLPAAAANGAVFTNAIPVGGVAGNGGISNTNSVAVNVTAIGAVSVSKAFSPASVAQGQPSTLTVTLTNGTASPIAGAALTDTLPTSPGPVVVAPTPNPTNTCGGAVTAVPGSGSVSIAGATIPGNGSCSFTVNAVGNTVGAHTNIIPAGALTSNGGATNPTEATANLTVTSGLTGTKTFSPTAVAKGGVSRVTIQVNNPTPAALTNVSIADPLPTGTRTLTVANPANATTTCSGSPVIAAVPGAGVASLTGATIPAGGNCRFLFDVVAGGSATTGNWTNTIPVGNIASAEGTQNTASIAATLTRNTATRIGINKSFDPIFVTGGQPSVLRIDVTNPIGSPSSANNLTFTDNLPTGIEVYAVPNTSTTCANGVVTAAPGGTSVRLSGATLPANSTCSVYVTTTSTKFLNLVNTIPASAITTTQGYTNSLATTATLSTLQGLGAAKSFSPTNITVGQTARLAIRLTSTLDPLSTTPTLTGVSFTDSLPSGLTVAPTPNASTDCTNGTLTAASGADSLTLSGATIGAGSSCFVYVDVTASALGVYTNIIPKDTATSNEGFKNSFDGIASLNVLDPPVIAKAFSPAVVKAGQVSTLTVTIANANAQTLSGAVLTDNLPAGLTVADPANASTDCGGGSVSAPVAGTSIALTNGTIPASGSCTFRADVVTNTPGAYPNVIAENALVTTEGGTNTAPATHTLRVLQPPTLTKAFAPNTVIVGESSMLTITLGNSNASAIALESNLIDTLPGVLKVASPNGLAGTCNLGSVTAVSGTNTIVYASGASIPAGGCTIQVAVTGAQAGSNQNLIPASGLVTDAGPNQTPATATLDVQAVALGNLVWIDDGSGGGTANDGIRNGTEPGVPGLDVLLYNGSDVQIGSTATDANGHYYFDNLVPGDYYVVIPASEFGVGQPLAGRISTTGAGADETSDQGVDENGIDDPSAATNGIRSNTFTLVLGGEQTGEDQTGYAGVLPDANVNATNDFGFIDPAAVLVAIGNRVWLDDGLGGGVANNGKLDGSEAGLVGVKVELYDSGNNLIDDTLTDANGRYWFDNLVAGDYTVHIPASELGSGKPLAGLFSSTDSTAKDEATDEGADENGIDAPAPATSGIGANTLTLTVGGETTDDDETGYTGLLPDANVNATVDFGFYNPLTTNVAIGNRVWLDNGAGTANDGILNGGEVGIDGVAVELYNSANTLIDSTVTADGGYYYFDDLPPGQYYTKLPASELGTGKTLAGLFSSTGAGTDETTDQSGDENGIDDPNPALNGIRSNTFNLQPGTEPTGEDDDFYPGALPDNSVNATADFGLVVPAATLVAIGNRVWLDDGAGSGDANDGILSGSEVGIANVEVQLYDSDNRLIGATATDANGRYWFDNLAEGDYYVLIPATELGVGEPLAGLLSSTDSAAKDETTDEGGDENGIDDADAATNGIRSNLFTLSVGVEATADDETDYPGVLPDANVNATNDFGFYNPVTTNVAIGNRVWLDNGAGTGDANDGVLSGSELGIDGVAVQLFNSGNALVRTTVTANGGYYYFDDLPPGQYYAKLPAGEFQGGGLAGLFSSTGGGGQETTDDTGDENGIDDASPAVNGIRSNTFNLQPGTEQTLENQDFYPGNLPDNSVNATADFGLIDPTATLVAIGNRVWLDNGAGGGLANDGIVDGAEVGIANVTVELYDGNGAFVSNTLTDGNGRYYFDYLAEGSYYVQIPSGAFGASGPLAGLLSTVDAGADQSADDDTDENGIDSPNPASSGVRSNTFSLTVGGSPTTDDQTGYTGALPSDSVNATDDFGFIVPAQTLVAIGNIVFRDGDGDGRFEPGATEYGIDGVTVELFFEGENPETVNPYRTTTTGGGGFYLFGNLPEGRYFVHIPKEELATGGDLAGLSSSTGAGGDTAIDDNGDENGIDGGTPSSQGVSSVVFDLGVGGEPAGESGAGVYTGNLPDTNVNLTADFGFYQEPLSCTVICDVVAPFGKTDQADILQINRMRGRKVTPNSANSGDCTGDGVISVNDARACQGYYGTYAP